MLDKPWKLSVKILILDNDGKFLLLRRSLNSKGNPGKWEPPGGKIDQGETFETALMREIEEETGLTASIQHVAGTSESELSKVKIVHLILEGKLESGQVHISEEHSEFEWIKPEELNNFDLADWFIPFAVEYLEKKASTLTRNT